MQNHSGVESVVLGMEILLPLHPWDLGGDILALNKHNKETTDLCSDTDSFIFPHSQITHKWKLGNSGSDIYLHTYHSCMVAFQE